MASSPADPPTSDALGSTDPQALTRTREIAEPDEHLLVERLRQGSAPAFDRAYSAYHARILAFLLRLSGRRHVAEDLAQETWLKFARAAKSMRPDTRLAPFLFTIARNAFLSHRRWAMLDVSRLVTMGFDSEVELASTTAPDDDHERARTMAVLEASLQDLPVASREVLLLVGVEGMEQEEVARVLGVSYDAMRQRLSRARAQLAKRMAERDAERRPRMDSSPNKGAFG